MSWLRGSLVALLLAVLVQFFIPSGDDEGGHSGGRVARNRRAPIYNYANGTQGCAVDDIGCISKSVLPMPVLACPARVTCYTEGSALVPFNGYISAAVPLPDVAGDYTLLEPSAATPSCLYVQIRLAPGAEQEPALPSALQITQVAIKYRDSRFLVKRVAGQVVAVQTSTQGATLSATTLSTTGVELFVGQFDAVLAMADGAQLRIAIAQAGLQITLDVPETYIAVERAGKCIGAAPSSSSWVSRLGASVSLFDATVPNSQFPIGADCGTLSFAQACSNVCSASGDSSLRSLTPARVRRLDTAPTTGSLALIVTDRLNVTAWRSVAAGCSDSGAATAVINTAVTVSWLGDTDPAVSTYSVTVGSSGRLVRSGILPDNVDTVDPSDHRIVLVLADGAEITLTSAALCSVWRVNVHVRLPAINYYYKQNCGACGTWGLQQSLQTDCFSSSSSAAYMSIDGAAGAQSMSAQADLMLATAPSTPPCVPLKLVSEFNAVLFGSFSAATGNVGGRLAVAGDVANITAIGIGSRLTGVDACREFVMFVGGRMQSFSSGRVWFGNVAVGAASSGYGADEQQRTLQTSCCALVRPAILNYTAMLEEVTSLSAFYRDQPETWTSMDVTYTTLTLALSGSALEIIDVPANFFVVTVKFIAPLANLLDGAIVVFNVAGTVAGIGNINMEALQGVNVIFNFYEATTVYVFGVNVRGTVMASGGTIENSSGSISGHLWAQSITGAASIEWSPLPFCQTPPVHRENCTHTEVVVGLPPPPPPPFYCPPSPPTPPPPRPPPPPPPTRFCLDLGNIVSALNVFVFDDITAAAAKIHASRNATGTLIVREDPALQSDFYCSPTLRLLAQKCPSGHPAGVSGRPSNFGPMVPSSCCVRAALDAIMASGFRDSMVALSASLALNSWTATVRKRGTIAVISFSNNAALETLLVQQGFFDTVTGFELINYNSVSPPVVINIPGTAVTLQSIDFTPFIGLPLILNFPDATTITLTSLTVEANILAPHAHVTGHDGVAYGYFVVASFTGDGFDFGAGPHVACCAGTLQFPACQDPSDEGDCPPPSPSPSTPSPSPSPTSSLHVNCTKCLDFGFLANGVSAIIFGAFSASSSAEGRVYVGGDARFDTGYSIGDRIVSELDSCSTSALVVGGTLRSWPDGRLYGGSIVTGQLGAAPEKRTVYPAECCTVVNPAYFPFEQVRSRAIAVSECLRNRTSTVVTANLDQYSPKLTMSGLISGVEVVQPSDYPSRPNYNNMPLLQNVAYGVPVVFNIPGKTVVMDGGSQEAYAALTIIYNFFEATSITIRTVGVRAHILAPYADIRDASGAIWGTVVAQSMSGQVSLGLHQLPPSCNASIVAHLPSISCPAMTQSSGADALAIIGPMLYSVLLLALAAIMF